MQQAKTSKTELCKCDVFQLTQQTSCLQLPLRLHTPLAAPKDLPQEDVFADLKKYIYTHTHTYVFIFACSTVKSFDVEF